MLPSDFIYSRFYSWPHVDLPPLNCSLWKYCKDNFLESRFFRSRHLQRIYSWSSPTLNTKILIGFTGKGSWSLFRLYKWFVSEQEVPAGPWLPTAFPESRKPSVSRSQGVISRQHWWIVFPFTGTKTKEGVVQSVTSGKSTAREGCGNLWWLLDLLGRPSPLPSGRSLWDTTDLPDLPTDE